MDAQFGYIEKSYSDKHKEEMLKVVTGDQNNPTTHEFFLPGWLSELIEKLRKYEILQYTPKELEIELNKFTILKLKLEKIEELIEKESDLDLHPNAEELDVNRKIMGLLNKFKIILEKKMKFPIIPKVKDHGKMSSVSGIDLSKSHYHKIIIPKGTTILILRDMIGNMQVQYELEIEVK